VSRYWQIAADIARVAARWRLRGRRWLRRSAVETELSEELQFFLDHHVLENVAKGMTAEEAQRVANDDMGSVLRIKDACRDVWGES
jgi:hypothetical protein